MPAPFSKRLLTWFEHSGRKDLPWQQDVTPYRVWVSEIMLQQTQVKTVIPYYQRFMATFPNVNALAAAAQDDVLHLWTGLGYYARARNLHAAAKLIIDEHAGEFPQTVAGLVALPGIGQSTAGAIISIACGQRAAILDGNVKRVLARHRAISGWPGKTAIHRQLWEVAEELTPSDRHAEYTQAIMDLGATLCTRVRPTCEICPVNQDCAANARGEQALFPGKKPRKKIPVKKAVFIMPVTRDGEVLLEKRPPSGIWGGLWCFPELPEQASVSDWALDNLAEEPQQQAVWEPFRHTFSHYHLDIQPVELTFPKVPERIMDANDHLWYNMRQPPQVGLAAPVAQLLARLGDDYTD